MLGPLFFKCMLCIHLKDEEAQAYKSLPTHSKWGKKRLTRGQMPCLEAPIQAPFSAFCPLGSMHLQALLVSVAWHTSACFQEASGLRRGLWPLLRPEASCMCGQSPHIEKKHTLGKCMLCIHLKKRGPSMALGMGQSPMQDRPHLVHFAL